MTDEEIEKIRSANERAERERTVPKGKSKYQDRLDLIQGSLRLCAVAALFCAQPETIPVFREYVKKMKIYPENEWITTVVLSQASFTTMDHSNAGEQVRGLEDAIERTIDVLFGGSGGPGPLSEVR